VGGRGGVDVAIEVRGSGGEDHRALGRGHRYDLEPRRVSPDPVHLDAGRHGGLAAHELHPATVVEAYELSERLGESERAIVLVLPGDARPELEFLALHPEGAAGEVRIAAPVVPVQV